MQLALKIFLALYLIFTALQSNAEDMDMGKGFSLTTSIGYGIGGSLETNLQMMAALSIEGQYSKESELLTDKARDKTRESIKHLGQQYRIFVSRYSQPHKMGGFYWGIGAGYRNAKVYWRNTYSPDSETDLSLVDDDNKVHHKFQMQGVTGHLRIGYRYVGDTHPIVFGGHIGVNHFESGFKELTEEELQLETEKNRAPLTKNEEGEIRRIFMTQVEPTVYLGVTF